MSFFCLTQFSTSFFLSFFCFIVALYLVCLDAPLFVETLDRRKRGFQDVDGSEDNPAQDFLYNIKTSFQHSILDLFLDVQRRLCLVAFLQLFSFFGKSGRAGEENFTRRDPCLLERREKSRGASPHFWICRVTDLQGRKKVASDDIPSGIFRSLRFSACLVAYFQFASRVCRTRRETN